MPSTINRTVICPFCKQRTWIEQEPWKGGLWYATCSCGMETPARDTLEEAVQACSLGGNEDDQIDELFGRVDGRLLAGDFGAVDGWLEELDVTETSTDLLVAWLSITWAARSKLQNRAEFVKRVEQTLQRRDPDRVQGLMQRLR